MHFTFNKSNDSWDMDVGDTDIFFNQTKASTQLMHGKVPWRGGREKDPVSLQILIEALTKPGAVVLDAYASTGDIHIYIFIKFLHINNECCFLF